MTIERLLDAGRALDAGQLDQAERIYRQVAKSDPRSSIAVVGLARVADRRGDPDSALRLAARALEIDPANAAARRLLDEHDTDRGSRPVGVGGAAGAAPARGTIADPSLEAWPWPDLDEQLARYRPTPPGRLGRLLRRGRGQRCG